MIDRGIIPENGLGTTTELPKFKNWNKRVQIIFVGLLIGAGLFGIYSISLGIMNMMEIPVMLSDNKIDTKYPLSAQSVFYENNMRNELIIYNNAAWNVKNVWVGTDEEYYAYINNRPVMGDTQYLFKGPFVYHGSFSYKIPIKVYSPHSGEDLLASVFNNERIFLMVVDGEKMHYIISMTGEKEGTKVNVYESKL